MSSLNSSPDEGGAASKNKRIDDEDQEPLLSDFSPEFRIRNILPYCHRDDLANIAMTCKQLRVDADHETLVQTRTAILNCGNSQAPFVDRLGTLQERGAFERFKHIKLLNHQLCGGASIVQARDAAQGLQLSFHSLELVSSSTPPSDGQARDNSWRVAYALVECMSPTLREFDFGHLAAGANILGRLAERCPNVERLRLDHCISPVGASNGHELSPWRKLKEISFENCLFYLNRPQQEAQHFALKDPAVFPFHLCNGQLERVSLVGAEYYGSRMRKPFTQLSLIKFVRGTPNLRWFRSDLNNENTAMLKAEFPHITFCS